VEKLRTILVDDHQVNLDILDRQLRVWCPEVEVIASCVEAADAINQINLLKPDLVFLDVEMPRLSGFDLLETLQPVTFSVIFLTSHEGYALEAFKVNATDYLVKPATEETLVAAIRKVQERRSKWSLQMLAEMVARVAPPKPQLQGLKKVAVATASSLEFITITDIVYCESESNYTTIHRNNTKPLIISKTLKIMEDLLPKEEFYRVHNSYLINMNHVDRFTREDGGYLVMSNQARILISRTKKDDFLSRFRQV
jgi:two-component system LytT family response regulator